MQVEPRLHCWMNCPIDNKEPVETSLSFREVVPDYIQSYICSLRNCSLNFGLLFLMTLFIFLRFILLNLHTLVFLTAMAEPSAGLEAGGSDMWHAMMWFCDSVASDWTREAGGAGRTSASGAGARKTLETSRWGATTEKRGWRAEMSWNELNIWNFNVLRFQEATVWKGGTVSKMSCTASCTWSLEMPVSGAPSVAASAWGKFLFSFKWAAHAWRHVHVERQRTNRSKSTRCI